MIHTYILLLLLLPIAVFAIVYVLGSTFREGWVAAQVAHLLPPLRSESSSYNITQTQPPDHPLWKQTSPRRRKHQSHGFTINHRPKTPRPLPFEEHPDWRVLVGHQSLGRGRCQCQQPGTPCCRCGYVVLRQVTGSRAAACQI